MAIPLGSRLGPYEIVGPLGSGGMGEVYRARDTKLNRDVAIKVLLSTVAHDADRLARFSREAQVLAALNHPNIAHIHGLEDSSGVPALVMELVEGPTLADRIAQGAIPVDEAVPIARQIAEALEAAHHIGIIHRDLKPANIKVRADGTVKVLDFGLAKALDTADGNPSAALEAGRQTADGFANSPTITSPAFTQAGMILGTAAYMSPEQARGKVVDARTDIWAFGCVLYEMLTGKRAFQGDDVTDTLVAVLSKEPDWQRLPSAASRLRPMLTRCLRKDPRQRLQAIGDARIALDELGGDDVVDTGSAGPAAARRGTAAIAISSAVGGALLAAAIVWMVTRPEPQAPRLLSQFELLPPDNDPVAINGADRDVAISPDGRYIVYRAGAGQADLILRAVDSLDSRRLPGTSNARQPFFSPDSRWIGFFQNQSLRRLPISGGAPITIIGNLSITRGASWGEDDVIVFGSQDEASGLRGVSVGGGDPISLTTPNKANGETAHWFPSVLPGRRGVLFTMTSPNAGERAHVAVLDLRTGQRKALFRGSHAEYVPSGHLIFALAGSLHAVPFDLERLEVRGAAVPVVENVLTTAAGAANYSVSAAGALVYIPARPASLRTLVWVDRAGRETPIAAPPHSYAEARLSPDGTKIAMTVREEDVDIWIWDMLRETATRLTFDRGIDQRPVWTPDGKRLVYSSQQSGVLNLYRRSADGAGTVERLTESTDSNLPTVVLPNDGGIVGFVLTQKTAADVVWFRGPGHTPETLIQTRFIEQNPEVSPNGRYLAYQSNESGLDEITVRPFPNVNDGRWQVSTTGGTRPAWAKDGRELFYLDPTDRLTVVPVNISAPTFSSGSPSRLFETAYAAPFNDPRTYDVSSDGSRFLMIKESPAQGPTPRGIVVALNWVERLRATP